MRDYIIHNKMDKACTNWNHGFVQDDLDDIQGVSVVLKNTEKKMEDLKKFIQKIERNVQQGKKRTIIKKGHKNILPIVIPRVNKNYLLLGHMQAGGTILRFKEKCPNWLVLLSECYAAIDESLFEVREELKQLCVKFTKQKDVYEKIHSERSKHLLLFTEDMKKIEEEMEKEKSTKGEYIKTLSGQIEEQKTILSENKAKRDVLKSTIDRIQEEIENLADKFWAADASIHYESEFQRGFKSKTEETEQKKLEEEEFLDQLRGELEVALRELEHVRYAANIDRFRLNENIRNVEDELRHEVERGQDMEASLERNTEAKQYFSELIVEKDEEKVKISEVLNERENELETEIKSLKKDREEVEEVLSEKKRHQEEYQSVNELLCVKVCTFELQITLQVNKIEKMKSNIHSEKKKFIVPLKQEINKQNAGINSFVDKSRTARLQLGSLSEKLSELEMIRSFLRHSEIEIQLFSNKEELRDSQCVTNQLSDLYEQWDSYAREDVLAANQLEDYREHVWSREKQIQSLNAEAENYWHELQSLRKEVQVAAWRYLSVWTKLRKRCCHAPAPVFVSSTLPKAPRLPFATARGATRGAIAAPLRMRTRALARADAPLAFKEPKATDALLSSKLKTSQGALTHEQIYANFGKFIIL